MNSTRQIKNELSSLLDLKVAVGAYQEIAASRMRKVKKSVLTNRAFTQGLADLYQRVYATYKLSQEHKSPSGLKLGLHAKTTLHKLREHNGKTVSVFVSSNTGLYGEIVRKTFNLFYTSVEKNKNDLVIIGRIGKQLTDAFLKGRAYKFYELNDALIEPQNIQSILSDLLQYQNVVVYHGMYASILSQEPTVTFVTGDVTKIADNKNAQELKCLIEPSIEEVLGFFEKQISSALFEQTMFESSLSKFASRMISLDFASDNINKRIEKTNLYRLKVMHDVENSAQSERLAGMSLWS